MEPEEAISIVRKKIYEASNHGACKYSVLEVKDELVGGKILTEEEFNNAFGALI